MKVPKKFKTLAHRYRIAHGKDFRLKDWAPEDTGKFHSPEEAADLLRQGVELLTQLQAKLYARENHALLLIFQAMDAAGKDGTIQHVMSGVNPQGCQVTSFKAPSTLELSHDFLWRSTLALPQRGRIGIFNRSYYEETLVVRVHPQLLEAQKLPPETPRRQLWHDRFEDINAYERHLSRSGTVIRKFFLHLSKAEQKRRFLARLDDPSKNWKFSGADLKERAYWDDYQAAYEETIAATASPEAPWYVIPADHKWFTHLAVAAVVVETLRSLDLKLPHLTHEQQAALEHAREVLG